MKGDVVKRWDAAQAQICSHRRGCTCDPCVQARGFLERMRQLIADIWQADKASPLVNRHDRTTGSDA